jgi:sugar O-acyltransferase (sialic acid O-acetyltransferase NeuD family)
MTVSTPIVLIAASGLAREVAEAVRAAGSHRLVAILDDDPARVGTFVQGIPVTGFVETANEHPDALFVICAGSGAARSAIADRLGAAGIGAERFATVVHPSVFVPGSCLVGAGSILLASVVLTADVTIGAHVVVMPRVALTHDDVVDDYATLCAAVTLGGEVHVGYAAYLGMSSCIRQRLTVGDGSVLGMGSVLLSDLPAGETWVGAPAHPIPSLTTLSLPAPFRYQPKYQKDSR